MVQYDKTTYRYKYKRNTLSMQAVNQIIFLIFTLKQSEKPFLVIFSFEMYREFRSVILKI